jgi:hypothetical protein
MKYDRITIYYDPIVKKWFKVTYMRGSVKVEELVIGE